MHDDSKPPGKCHACLSQTSTFGNLLGPGFEGEVATTARQDRVGRFVEQLADHAIALFGDTSRPVDFPRLVTSGDQSEVGTDGAGLSEAVSLINGRGKSGGSLNADDW